MSTPISRTERRRRKGKGEGKGKGMGRVEQHLTSSSPLAAAATVVVVPPWNLMTSEMLEGRVDELQVESMVKP